jgi:hypothetical protein
MGCKSQEYSLPRVTKIVTYVEMTDRSLVIRQGWELVPGTRRVWLHTSSADNPHALPNYHRRAFRIFRTEQHDG